LNFRGVNDALRKLANSGVEFNDESLWSETLIWGKKRNGFIHGMASLEESGGHSWRKRLKEAKCVADTGLGLSKRWMHEVNKHRI
jgi:hypothetical protein